MNLEDLLKMDLPDDELEILLREINNDNRHTQNDTEL